MQGKRNLVCKIGMFEKFGDRMGWGKRLVVKFWKVSKIEGLRKLDSIPAWKSLRVKKNVITENKKIEICFGEKMARRVFIYMHVHTFVSCNINKEWRINFFMPRGNKGIMKGTWVSTAKKGYLSQGGQGSFCRVVLTTPMELHSWDLEVYWARLGYQTRRVDTMRRSSFFLATSLAKIRQLVIILNWEHRKIPKVTAPVAAFRVCYFWCSTCYFWCFTFGEQKRWCDWDEMLLLPVTAEVIKTWKENICN